MNPADIITSEPATTTDAMNLVEIHQAFQEHRKGYRQPKVPPIPDEILRPALEAVTGEPVVLANDVRYDLKHPCDDCPFVKDSAFHQGVARHLPDTLRAIETGTFAHTCHKTDPRPSCDGPHLHDGPVQHCAGAIIMLFKSQNGRWMQAPLIKAFSEKRVDLNYFEELANRDRRVWSVKAMARFYIRELSKRRANPAEFGMDE